MRYMLNLSQIFQLCIDNFLMIIVPQSEITSTARVGYHIIINSQNYSILISAAHPHITGWIDWMNWPNISEI